jgi:hypothetical protein
MKMILIVMFLLHLKPAFANDVKLEPFVTDYCTNYPEGTKEEPDLWKHCCLMHDLYFWAGGSKEDRSNADMELKECIEVTGATQIARLVYLAVRAGSYSPIKYPDKKWSNGWSERPEFLPLSSEELQLIESEILSGHEEISSLHKQHFILQLRSREN